MNKLKSLSLVTLAALGLSAYGGTTTNEWWNVTLEDDSFQDGFPGLTIGELGTLTNDEDKAQCVQPYAEGVWEMIEGDESYVTNGIVTNFVDGVLTEVADSVYLKLDTQGNDLTWNAKTNDVPDNIKALVDADLLLVGSDSAPDATDFDAAGDVHTAVYLKNETHEDSGETTNSVLCVYVFDGTDARYWQELDGVELEDNAWAHVQVVVDYTDASSPMVQVFVNGTQMHARGDASTVSWPAAVSAGGGNFYKLSSVAFRGTGAVDNFVGETQLVTYDQAYFKAEVYLDGQVTNELCQVTAKPFDIGGVEKPSFAGFSFDNLAETDPDPATYALSKIEIIDFANDRTRTYEYDYDPTDEDADGIYMEPKPGTEETEDIYFDPEPVEGYQIGTFSVKAPTAGAVKPADENEPVTIVKIYFKTIGAYDAYVTTDVGGTVTTDATTLKPVAAGGVYPTNLVWTFDAVKGDTILTNLVVSNGATFDGYANGKATVKVTVAGALAADTLYAAASYVAGALAEGQDLRPTTNGNEIVFAPYTPPVAMIGASEYPSLRAAIEAAQDGDTITLVHDDLVSFTVEAPVVIIDKAVTIEGGSNKVYGVSAYDFTNEEIRHAFRITGSGNVTIKDLTLTEFGGSAPTVQYYTYPIWTLAEYTGTITLDNVTVEKFARTAFNFIGGSFVVQNCTIDGYGDDPGCPETYFQDGINIYNASGSVSNTVMTGLGSANTDESSCFTLMNTGSLTVYDGTYGSDYVVGLFDGQTSTLDIRGGSFVATKAGATSIFNGETNGLTATISGGWFTLAPEADFIAAGYTVEEDVPGAPVDGAYQHVVPEAVTYDITFNDEDGTFIVTTNVAAGVTDYAPADPVPAAGFTFAGWTNVLDATTVYTAATMPAAAANATYAAKYEASAVTKPEVDVGQGLKDYVPAQGETVPAPIEFTDAATPLCELSFVAPEAGWYFLYTSTTVNGEYTPDYTTKVQANQGALVTLTESAAGTTKFFKIGWSETEPTAE